MNWEINKSYLLLRIREYLGNGGLFNPEQMEHDKVRDLIMDIRDYLYELEDFSI